MKETKKGASAKTRNNNPDAATSQKASIRSQVSYRYNPAQTIKVKLLTEAKSVQAVSTASIRMCKETNDELKGGGCAQGFACVLAKDSAPYP